MGRFSHVEYGWGSELNAYPARDRRHNTIFLRPDEWFVDEQYVFAYCNGEQVIGSIQVRYAMYCYWSKKQFKKKRKKDVSYAAPRTFMKSAGLSASASASVSLSISSISSHAVPL
jgi:hypothetical protein